jgi:predicted exporter
MMEGPLRRHLIVGITGGVGNSAMSTARAMATDLSPEPGLLRVRGGPDPEMETALFDTYFPRRNDFAEPDVEQLDDFWSLKALEERLRRTRSFLTLPGSSAYRSLLFRDPLLLFRDRLGELSSAQPLRVETLEGQFLAEDGTALLFLQLRPGISFEQRSAVLKAIKASFARRGGRGETLEMSGSLPFEVYAEETTRRDMRRVGAISLSAVVLLCLLLFRSLAPWVMVILCIATGLLSGLTVTLLFFGHIHGLTLAFGGTLIGVGADYPLHFLNEQALVNESGRRALRRVKHGLLVGAGTTVAGFLAFLATGSQALMQVAAFAACGLLACLATCFLLAPIWPVGGGAGKAQRFLMHAVSAWTAPLRGLSWGGSLLLVAVLLSVVVGSFTLSWNMDASAINPSPRELREQDERLRQRLTRDSHILAIVGPQLEPLVDRSHALWLQFQSLVQQGHVERIASLSSVYLPQWVQLRNREISSSRGAHEALRAALRSEGFEESAFAEAWSEKQERPSLLSLEEFRTGPLAELAEPFLFTSAEQNAVFLHVVGERKAIQNIVDKEPNVEFYEPEAFVVRAFARLTQSLTRVLWGGVALMALVVLLRYRAFLPMLAVCAPACIASLGSLCVLSVFQELHSFHALAALVVMAMGIDYGAFVVESRRGAQLPPWPSLVAAATSTVASFGALAFSSVPALRAIGSVLCVGIVLAFLFSLISDGLVNGPELGS